MIKNFFLVAYRNLLRNKGFSAINITGLAVGMASAVLICLWIQSEVSYDKFHEKKARIFEVWNKAHLNNELWAWNNTPKITARTMETDLPEVERSVRVDHGDSYLFSVGDKRVTKRGSTVDTGFLQMFTFPLQKGNPATALNDMHSIVITETLGKSLFGQDDAMGKTIKLDNQDNFTVTGVLKDLPHNSRFTFEYLLPWSYLKFRGRDDSSWDNNSTTTYVLLKNNATLTSVQPKVKLLKQKYNEDAKQNHWEMFLYPLERWRLYSSFTNGVEDNGGRVTFIKLFTVIAIFILLIACINFMNLSTARSEKRAKEVGIRKVVGAQKSSLIGQFIGESVLLAFLASLVAILLVALSLPGFNHLTEKKLFINFASGYTWAVGLGFVLFTGILAGSYPAFFLSSFQPVKVLKGTFTKANALVTPRKMLVILQFSFAIILIICTIIVKQQIDFGKERETGYDRRNLIYHFLTGDIKKNYQLVKNELLNKGIASSVVKTSQPITQMNSDGWGQSWEGKDPNDKTDMVRFFEDEGLGLTAALHFTQGRDFDLRKFPTDSTAMIINETALKVMKFKKPLGQIVGDMGVDYHVVGVIRDFILTGPYDPTKPMIISGAKQTSWFNCMMVKFNANNSTGANLKAAEAVFKKYNPEYPFEYNFVDQEYAKKFESEQQQGTLAALFSGLTIFISCLGLFGLATYMAENRIKEVGVRKVLGASVAGIATLLSKDFVKLVVISFAIAAPLAWWGMYKWLQSYEYRVPIHWWVFVLACVLSIGIAIITVSYQAIRAALANPVRSLRSE